MPPSTCPLLQSEAAIHTVPHRLRSDKRTAPARALPASPPSSHVHNHAQISEDRPRGGVHDRGFGGITSHRLDGRKRGKARPSDSETGITWSPNRSRSTQGRNTVHTSHSVPRRRTPWGIHQHSEFRWAREATRACAFLRPRRAGPLHPGAAALCSLSPRQQAATGNRGRASCLFSLPSPRGDRRGVRAGPVLPATGRLSVEFQGEANVVRSPWLSVCEFIIHKVRCGPASASLRPCLFFGWFKHSGGGGAVYEPPPPPHPTSQQS